MSGASFQPRDFPRLEDLSLIALDLDGTVTCPHGKTPLSVRCLAAVKRLVELGLPVTFVTGRTEDYASPLAERFGLTTPMVTYNGGRLYSHTEKRALHQASIPDPRIAELLGWLDELPEVVAVYFEGKSGMKLVQNRPSGSEETDDHLFGTPRRVVGNLAAAWEEGETLSKVIVVTARALEGELLRRFGNEIQVVRTHPSLFEILPGGVSKGSGVSRLCAQMGIDPARVLAIGDQENDVSTFQTVGYSVAMGDAPNSVKAAATWVTASFDQEGCAQVLEALLEGNPAAPRRLA